MESRWLIFNLLKLVLISKVLKLDYKYVKDEMLECILMLFGMNLELNELSELFGLNDCEICGDFWGDAVRRELELLLSMSMVHMYPCGCVDV